MPYGEEQVRREASPRVKTQNPALVSFQALIWKAACFNFHSEPLCWAESLLYLEIDLLSY